MFLGGFRDGFMERSREWKICFRGKMSAQGNMGSTVPLFKEKDSFSMIFLSYAPVGEQEFPPAGINARRKSNNLFSFLKRY